MCAQTAIRKKKTNQQNQRNKTPSIVTNKEEEEGEKKKRPLDTFHVVNDVKRKCINANVARTSLSRLFTSLA